METETTTTAWAGLEPALMQAINELGFTEPTPIQSQAMPPLLAGHDVIGRARTGSGKTALLRCLNSGIENPDSGMGCYAMQVGQAPGRSDRASRGGWTDRGAPTGA